MSISQNDNWFSTIDVIIDDPLRFKKKLDIGEDAYATLRAIKYASEAFGFLGAVRGGAAIAQSTKVASILFAGSGSSGILSFFGVGAAVTPIGWVVAAGVLTGGAWLGITRYLKSSQNKRVTVIPEFINTPLDVLALGLFDLLAPLALKVAVVDGEIHALEEKCITEYFIQEWGYDPQFVKEGIAFTKMSLDDFSIKKLALTLAEFKRSNADCNYKTMSKEIVIFLSEIMAADGKLDEREEVAIEKVSAIFRAGNKFSITRITKLKSQI